MKKKVATSFFRWLGGIGVTFLCVVFLVYQPSYIPRPHGFHHIALPMPSYQALPDTFPYQFEFSKYAIWLPDTSTIKEPYWINVYYPDFSASIQITYKPVKNNPLLLQKYLEDAYKLTTKHQVRAYEIEEQVVQTPHGLQASFVSINGEVPTPYQFYTTDSVNHFLRAALYFNTASHNDSLAPIIDFIKDDMRHMVYTLQWCK